jgi:hypothetical protein
MLTTEECALVNDIGDRLLELYVERDDAVSDGDLDRAHQLQAEIDDARLSDRKSSGASKSCSSFVL